MHALVYSPGTKAFKTQASTARVATKKKSVHIMCCSITIQRHGFVVAALQQHTVLMSASPIQRKKIMRLINLNSNTDITPVLYGAPVLLVSDKICFLEVMLKGLVSGGCVS